MLLLLYAIISFYIQISLLTLVRSRTGSDFNRKIESAVINCMLLIRRKEPCSNMKTPFLGSDAFSTAASQSERILHVHCCYALLCRLRPIN